MSLTKMPTWLIESEYGMEPSSGRFYVVYRYSSVASFKSRVASKTGLPCNLERGTCNLDLGAAHEPPRRRDAAPEGACHGAVLAFEVGGLAGKVKSRSEERRVGKEC